MLLGEETTQISNVRVNQAIQVHSLIEKVNPEQHLDIHMLNQRPIWQEAATLTHNYISYMEGQMTLMHKTLCGVAQLVPIDTPIPNIPVVLEKKIQEAEHTRIDAASKIEESKRWRKEEIGRAHV